MCLTEDHSLRETVPEAVEGAAQVACSGFMMSANTGLHHLLWDLIALGTCVSRRPLCCAPSWWLVRVGSAFSSLSTYGRAGKVAANGFPVPSGAHGLLLPRHIRVPWGFRPSHTPHFILATPPLSTLSRVFGANWLMTLVVPSFTLKTPSVGDKLNGHFVYSKNWKENSMV